MNKPSRTQMATLVVFFFLTGLFTSGVAQEGRPAKPNIVIILSDDQGWQDIAAMNAQGQSWAGTKSWVTPFETPFMDQLIDQGMMFTQGYSGSSVCSPSRGSILSGKSPTSVGRTHVIGGKAPTVSGSLITPHYMARMPESEITIAEALNARGYYSGHVGKWHCAYDHTAFPNAQDQGFHEFYYHGRGATITPPSWSTWKEGDPYRNKEYKEMYERNQVKGYNHPTVFTTDSVTEYAVNFVKKGAEVKKPFFLYLATWLVHTPIQTRNKALHDYYVDKMKKVNVPKQSNVKYASMVTTLDWTVGNVLDALRHTDDPRWPGHKLIENTYIFFTSDNGGLEPYTDNFPLDEGKHDLEEGGVHVPYIVMGPGIKAGSINESMVIHSDIYPTVMALTGTAVPKGQRVEGVDLSPVLFGEASSILKHEDHPYFKDQVREALVWHHPTKNRSSIRRRGWKLIKNYSNKNILASSKTVPYKLFQLYGDDNKTIVDLGEQKNLAESNPDKVAELDSILQGYLGTYDFGERPYYSPKFTGYVGSLKTARTKAPVPGDMGVSGDTAWVKFTSKGTALSHAWLMYHKGGHLYNNNGAPEWFRIQAQVDEAGGRVWAVIPKRTVQYQFNLVDKNNFLQVSAKKKSTLPIVPCKTPEDYQGESKFGPTTMGDQCYEGVPDYSTGIPRADLKIKETFLTQNYLRVTENGFVLTKPVDGLEYIDLVDLKGKWVSRIKLKGDEVLFDRFMTTSGLYIARTVGVSSVLSQVVMLD